MDVNEENTSLELICDASIYADEAECWLPSVDDLDRRIEKRIHELEEESKMLKKQNDALNSKLDSLSQEKDQNQINLTDCKNALRAYSSAMDDAELEIQRSNEILDQNTLQLKYLEENLEESFAIIKDLRQTKRELKMELEERLAFTSLAGMKESRGENVGPISCPQSLAEEIQETEHEKLSTPQALTADLHNNRCAEMVGTLAHLWVYMLCVIIFAGMIVGSFFPLNISSSVGQLILKPFCNVRYGALPPV